jgi:hypothetical protein
MLDQLAERAFSVYGKEWKGQCPARAGQGQFIYESRKRNRTGLTGCSGFTEQDQKLSHDQPCCHPVHPDQPVNPVPFLRRWVNHDQSVAA